MRDLPIDLLIVPRAELEALTLPLRVPEQVAEEHLRVVVAHLWHVRQCPAEMRLPAVKLDTFRCKEVPVNPRIGLFCQPGFKILEELREALEHRIGRACHAVFPVLIGPPALHIKPWPSPKASIHSLCKDAVNLAGVRFRTAHRGAVFRQERLVEPMRMWPNFPRHKTV